jgi:diguanylate cyclase (GGDEF)-like protein
VRRPEDAAVSADKILMALSAVHHIDQQEVKITVSVGIGVFPEDGAEPELLIRNADKALLCAKRRGRNRREFVAGTWTLRESGAV